MCKSKQIYSIKRIIVTFNCWIMVTCKPVMGMMASKGFQYIFIVLENNLLVFEVRLR